MVEPSLSSRFFDQLPEFLESIRESGLAIDPEQQLRLTRLLAQLAAERRIPNDAASLSRVITPVIAGTPSQQGTCEELFNLWFGDGSERRGFSKPSEPGDQIAEEGQRGWWRHAISARAAAIISVIMAAIACIAIVLYFPLPANQSRDSDGKPTKVVSRDLREALNEWLTSYPIRDLEPLRQSPWNRSWRWYYTEYDATKTVVALLPWTLYAAGMGWLTYLAIVHLRREALRRSLQSVNWRIDMVRGRFGNRTLLSELQPLRNVARDVVKVLDTEMTIQESARAGGLLQPKFSDRPVACDFVALIEQCGPRDHLAEHNRQVIRAVQDAGIFVEVYEFDRDPRLCRSVRSGEFARLQNLITKFGESVVLVFIEADHLIDPATGQPMRWLDHFQSVPRCFLLTPSKNAIPLMVGRYPHEMWIPNIPIETRGLLEIVRHVTGSGTAVMKSPEDKESEDERALIEFLAERPGRWLQQASPSRNDVNQLIELIGRAFGSSGYQWIAASAFYPELRWPLTLALKSALKDGEGKVAYDRQLLVASQLPWFRLGWMPEWLRSAFASTLSLAQARDIRRALLRAIGMSATSGSPRDTLQIDLSRKRSPSGSSLKADNIFLEFILPLLNLSRRLFMIPTSWISEIIRKPVRNLAIAAVVGALAAFIGTFVALSFVPIDDCDLYAASNWDNFRIGPSESARLLKRLPEGLAEGACKRAIERHPENARFRYQYGVTLKDRNAANASFSEAAAAGYPFAIVHLAWNSSSDPENDPKVEQAIRRSLALGNKASYFALWLYYWKKDPAQAFKYAKLASEEGGVMYDIYAMYFSGFEGVEKLGGRIVEENHGKFIEILQRGVRNHDADAAVTLSARFYNGDYVGQDDRRAEELLSLAVRWGAGPEAARNLGILYQDRDSPTSEDLERATYWLTSAAKQGEAEALVYLAEMIVSGRARFAAGHEPPSTLDPFTFVRIAAINGNAEAQFRLGSKLEEEARGDEVKKAEAIDWYRKARDQKHDGAKRALERLGSP